MRRIYHRFPNIIDLEFDINRPFRDVLICLRGLHNCHTTERQGSDLIKRSVVVQVATGKTGFEPLDLVPPFENLASEAIDYRLSMQDTYLKPGGRVPASQSNFFLRVTDRGSTSECTVAKDGKSGPMDAIDVKKFLAGACA